MRVISTASVVSLALYGLLRFPSHKTHTASVSHTAPKYSPRYGRRAAQCARIAALAAALQPCNTSAAQWTLSRPQHCSTRSQGAIGCAAQRRPHDRAAMLRNLAINTLQLEGTHRAAHGLAKDGPPSSPARPARSSSGSARSPSFQIETQLY